MFHVVKAEPSPSREALTGRIDFSIQLKNGNNQRYMILDARAPVYLRTPDGRRLFIDHSFSHQMNQYTETARGGDAYLRMFMPMTHANAVLIEEARGNGKVTLSLEVVVIALPLDGAPSSNVPARTEALVDARIEKSQWVEEFLPAFGMDDYELWEVRFPHTPTPAVLKVEADLLRTALHEYNRGEYANCYQNCRKVVESFKKRKTELDVEGVVHPQEWGRAEHYLSTALHVDDELPSKILRRDQSIRGSSPVTFEGPCS